MTPEEERRTALQADIDARMTDVWAVVWQPGSPLEPVMDDERMRVSFAAMLRTAYAMGYQDALHEERHGKRGALAKRHGYFIP